ncbi:MAG: hypothetical protein FWG98_07725 [Candidatus Cloacimonetes bacterium]|nr:hypothetical protein [Candidatus Cloacimonadota bacterium]
MSKINLKSHFVTPFKSWYGGSKPYDYTEHFLSMTFFIDKKQVIKTMTQLKYRIYYASN